MTRAVTQAVALTVDGKRVVLNGRPEGPPTASLAISERELLEVWEPVDDDAMRIIATLAKKMHSHEASVGQLAGALVEANDQLVAVYDLARVHAGSLEEDEAVVRLLNEACRLLHSDVAILTDNAKMSYRSDETADIEWLSSCVSSYIETGSPAVVDDGAGSSALLVDVVGSDGGSLVLAMSRRRDGRYLTGDRRLAEAIADTLNGVLSTSALHRQALVRKEHDTAAQLAQSALPRYQPDMAGIDATARTYPARAAGGDFFTYASDGDAFHFVVGDVSGKGLPAAIVMSTLVSASNSALRRYGDDGPSAVMKAIDDDAYDYLSDSGLFATMVVGSMWPEQGLIEFVNAGHGPVMIGRAESIAQIDACAPPVGVLPLGELEATSWLLESSDLVVIGSDGLTEQENLDGAMYGEDQLGELIRTCIGMDSTAVSDRVLEAVGAFAGAAPQSDDRTIMVLQLDNPEIDESADSNEITKDDEHARR